MKKIWKDFTTWLLAPAGKEVDREIAIRNNTNIHYISLIAGIVQLISLTVFILVNYSNIIGNEDVFIPVINVSLSVVLCAAGFIVSRYFRNNDELFETHPTAAKGFVIIFIVLLIVWGMAASVRTFLNGLQILTFYTVELLVVLLIRIRPAVIAAIILGSYTAFYCWLEILLIPGKLNIYNYIMLAALSVIGAVINYRLAVDNIKQRNTANHLNDSLEIIANHDSLTRLKNRYALNQAIPDYLNTDVCLAIGDIDGFKQINDKYGHRTGDDVLKTFADILQKYFGHNEVYRYGGDEFLILSHGDDCTVLSEKLAKLNEELGKVKIRDTELKLRCSFGCEADFPHDIAEFFDIIMRADKKLYEVKKGS